MRTMRGEPFGEDVRQRLAKKAQSLSDDDAALQKKAANLIDHCGPLADEARPDPVQRLQIQLFVGFGWNKACRRPLYRLSYGMGISEIILVPLPKGLCVRGRYLLHVVAQRGKLPSNVVSRHPRFDTDKTGRQIRSLDVMRPRETFSRNTMPPRVSRPIM